MNAADLPHPVYEPVLNDFLQQDVQPVLIGGAAVVLLGGRRVTPDLDISFPDMDIALAVLYRNDFKVVAEWIYDENAMEWKARPFDSAQAAAHAIRLEKRRAFRTIHPKTGFLLDVWLNLHISHEDLLAEAKKVKIQGKDVSVASIDHLIELKRRAIEESADPEKCGKHEADIQSLLGIKRRRSSSHPG